jgi:hypothetical protein
MNNVSVCTPNRAGKAEHIPGRPRAGKAMDVQLLDSRFALGYG